MYKHINALKTKVTLTSIIRTTAVVGMTGNLFPHCAVVGRSAPHKKNACYFDPKNMTERREWDRKLMDEKGAACKDGD